jgi:hypothetical protein
MDLKEVVLKNTPEKFINKLMGLEEKMYFRKGRFFPNNFKSSHGYNESIIICMTPFSTLYMTVSLEIENYLKKDNHTREGELTTNNRHRINFLKEVSKAAEETMEWALEARLRYMNEYNGHSPRDDLSGVTQKYTTVNYWHNNNWESVQVGAVPILYYKVREMTINVIYENVYKPVNVFLQNSSLPLLQKYVDRKVFDASTIYGERCLTPCMESSGGYWWCYYNDYNIWLSSWDYCSPPEIIQKTYKGEVCSGSCAKGSFSYFWCTTEESWDYCSPKPLEIVGDLKMPEYFAEKTITGESCRTKCEKDGGSWSWSCKPRKSKNYTAVIF